MFKLSAPRLFLLLTALGAVGAAAFILMPKAFAMPPVMTTVVCNGSACGGAGPKMYRYDVNPGPSGCTRLEVGIHDNNVPLLYTAPAGWTVSVVAASRLDHIPWTNHGGGPVTSNGTCSWKMVWTGPNQTAPFTIAYNSGLVDTVPHDVHWNTSDGSRADWTKVVGLGLGPIHSPMQNL